MYNNGSSGKNKSHPDVINYFKELPFYNTYIEKPKIKRLKNIDLLSKLPFYEELNLFKYIDSDIKLDNNKYNQKPPHVYVMTRYPAGSDPGKFYGTAKIHNFSYNDTIDQLPLRPIVSNIGTASYHLFRYLAKLLSPLSQSEYTVKSSK